MTSTALADKVSMGMRDLADQVVAEAHGGRSSAAQPAVLRELQAIA